MVLKQLSLFEINIKELPDYILINLYKNGNIKAFETLLSKYEMELYNYIFSFTHNKELSNDLFQDTVLKAIEAIQHGKYKESGKFSPWLKRIAHNIIIDYFLNEKKTKDFFANSFADNREDNFNFSEKSIEDTLFNEQIMIDVVKLVDFLPFPQQSVVRMRFFQDMDFNEIAKTDNISVNTALGRMRYALLNLRRIVREKKIDLKFK